MPDGGMAVQNTNIATVKRFDLDFDDAVFDPPVAAITTYRAGMILGRVTADSKLRPFTAAATHGVGTAVPVGVLGTAVVSDAVPTDENIRYIVRGGVREDQLSIDTAGLAGVGITEAVKDLLRQTGITPLSAEDLSQLDNQ